MIPVLFVRLHYIDYLHDCLIVQVGLIRIEEGIRQLCKLFFTGTGINRRMDAEIAGEKPENISIDNGKRELEGERSNGGRRIFADTFQRQYIVV